MKLLMLIVVVFLLSCGSDNIVKSTEPDCSATIMALEDSVIVLAADLLEHKKILGMTQGQLRAQAFKLICYDEWLTARQLETDCEE